MTSVPRERCQEKGQTAKPELPRPPLEIFVAWNGDTRLTTQGLNKCMEHLVSSPHTSSDIKVLSDSRILNPGTTRVRVQVANDHYKYRHGSQDMGGVINSKH